MDQDRQNANPEEVAGGYGTPTVEQETGGGGDDKQFAQPREEEAFDAAGLSQDSPDGENYPAAAPDLSHLGAEDQDSAGEPGAGRHGGTEDQAHAEQDSDSPGFGEAQSPSADAEMEEGNTEQPDPERPYSSEPVGDATGLPEELSPKDDEDSGERFDAG